MRRLHLAVIIVVIAVVAIGGVVYWASQQPVKTSNQIVNTEVSVNPHGKYSKWLTVTNCYKNPKLEVYISQQNTYTKLLVMVLRGNGAIWEKRYISGSQMINLPGEGSYALVVENPSNTQVKLHIEATLSYYDTCK